MRRTCFFSLEITLAYDLKLKRNLVKDRIDYCVLICKSWSVETKMSYLGRLYFLVTT